MRRTLAAALAALLIAGGLALAGCASWLESPNKPANDAVTIADSHIKKSDAAGSAATLSAGQLDAIPYTKAGAEQALTLTAQIKDSLAIQKDELTAAKAAMDSIAAMEVDPEIKQYAKLESVALEARVKVVDAGVRLYTEMDAFYEALKKGKTTSVDVQKILDEVETIKRDITALSELAAEQGKAASDYFDEKRLGG